MDVNKEFKFFVKIKKKMGGGVGGLGRGGGGVGGWGGGQGGCNREVKFYENSK